MKKLSAAIFATLSLVLASCGDTTTPTPASVGSIELSIADQLKVGDAAKATATVKSTTGEVMTSKVTYSSDQPNVIAVDENGSLTIKRLTATDKPVTITATVDGKTATKQVKTYGMEMALGTHALIEGVKKVGIEVTIRVRPPEGTSNIKTVTLIPANGKKVIFPKINAKSVVSFILMDESDFSLTSPMTVEVSDDLQSYTASGKIPNPEYTIPETVTTKPVGSGKSFSFNYKPSPEVKSYYITSDFKTKSPTTTMGNGTISFKFSDDTPSGEKKIYLTTSDFIFGKDLFENVLPNQVNATEIFIGTVNVQ